MALAAHVCCAAMQRYRYVLLGTTYSMDAKTASMEVLETYSEGLSAEIKDVDPVHIRAYTYVSTL